MQETCLLFQNTVLRAASLSFHRDSENGLLMTMRVYLTVLLIAELIIMCPGIHLPTFQPPVDDATFLALSPVKDFIVR